MPFFIRKKQGKPGSLKRKKTTKSKKNAKEIKNGPKANNLDEIISSDEEISETENHEDKKEEYSSEEETEQEKRLRLTKKYLEQIENEEREKNLSESLKDVVAQRLKDEALDEAGKLQKKKAHEYEGIQPEIYCIFRRHKLSITCLVISSDENFLFSGSKDCSIIKWDLQNKKHLKTIPGGRKETEATHIGHIDHILALALSSDDKFLASGCKNKIINIWDPNTMELLKTFRGHKGAITGLVFQKDLHQLVSASTDRSLKLWNLDEMGYMETLFGHQDEITGIDCFYGENVLTSGGKDSTLRIWKIAEESQLVYQGLGTSIDCVCVSSPQRFISGSDDGYILLWGTHKKKPLFKLNAAHGSDPETKEGNWIITLCALKNTDLIASGSKDGLIKLWKRNDENNSMSLVSTISVTGFVNSLQFTSSGKYLIAGIGQEHRLGRWWRLKESKNSIVIYSWPKIN